ncbi:MAG: hypothetical protein LBP96_00065 [Bacteroidales bacterium]|jgi:hypothetical protein|nr:hypothetical protein [Bacteroidales bacterium]
MENLINDYIAKKKNETPTPFLDERIIQNINTSAEAMHASPLRTLWKGTIVAASFAAVILMGVALGNSYQTKPPKEQILVVDDRYMEQLYIFKNNKNG